MHVETNTQMQCVCSYRRMNLRRRFCLSGDPAVKEIVAVRRHPTLADLHFLCQANSSSSALASCKSFVPNPWVNQP
jgi:hypothetical protein